MSELGLPSWLCCIALGELLQLAGALSVGMWNHCAQLSFALKMKLIDDSWAALGPLAGSDTATTIITVTSLLFTLGT